MLSKSSKLNSLIAHIEKVEPDIKQKPKIYNKPIKTKVVSLIKGTVPFFKRFKIRFSEFVVNHKADLKYLLLIIPIAAAGFLAIEIQHRQSLESKASLYQAKVSIQPENFSLPPETTFGLWVEANTSVAFADIELNFDTKLVKLTSEITILGGLSRSVKVTSMEEANTTGKISIIAALDPTNLSTPPTEVFQIASLKFDTNTASQNEIASISFLDSAMQIVAIDQTILGLTTTPLSLTLNPASPSPTITATATATSIATAAATATATSTSSAVPTSTTTETSSPVPTATSTETLTPTSIATATPTVTASPVADNAIATASPAPASSENSPSQSSSSNSSSNSSGGSIVSNSKSKGDLNTDGKVNITDLSIILTNFGKANRSGDVNSDGKVDIKDLSIILSHWLK